MVGKPLLRDDFYIYEVVSFTWHKIISFFFFSSKELLIFISKKIPFNKHLWELLLISSLALAPKRHIPRCHGGLMGIKVWEIVFNFDHFLYNKWFFFFLLYSQQIFLSTNARSLTQFWTYIGEYLKEIRKFFCTTHALLGSSVNSNAFSFNTFYIFIHSPETFQTVTTLGLTSCQ